jgi:hypothetical protein
MNIDIFKAGEAVVKDKGVMADLSKKIELFINELDDENIVKLNRLVKQRSVGIILVPSDKFDVIYDVIKQATEYLEDEEPEPESEATITAEDLPELEGNSMTSGYGFS